MKMTRIVLVIILAGMLWADVVYEMDMTSEGMMVMGSGKSAVKVFIKEDRARTEITSGEEGQEQTSSTIMRLDKDVIWNLDIENKEYIETPISQDTLVAEDTGEVVDVEITVEETGQTKKILNADCEETIVTMEVESDGGTVKFVQILWVALDIPGYEELTGFHKQLAEHGLGKIQSSKVASNHEAYKDFEDKVSEVEGFPLEATFEMVMGAPPMVFSMKTHTIVTKIETVPVHPRVFEIPQGFVKKE